MSTCAKCGVNVGCGCQLTNGLCASCLSKQADQAKVAKTPGPPPPPGPNKN